MVKVDYVDEDDKTQGSASFDEILKNKLTYREVIVMISNEASEIFLRKEDGVWSSSLRGNLVSGEVYEDAGLRLLKQSYSSNVKEKDLDFYSKDYITSNVKSNRFVEIYKVKLEGPFNVDGMFCSAKKIRKLIENKEEFTDVLRVILKNYYRIKLD